MNSNEPLDGATEPDDALRALLRSSDPASDVALDDDVLHRIRVRGDRRRAGKRAILACSAAVVVLLLLGSVALARSGARDDELNTASVAQTTAAAPGDIGTTALDEGSQSPTTRAGADTTTLDVPTSSVTSSPATVTIAPTAPTPPPTTQPCYRSNGPEPGRTPMTILGSPASQATGTATVRGRYEGFEGTPVTLSLTSLGVHVRDFRTEADGSFTITVPAGCQTRYDLDGPKWPSDPNSCSGYTFLLYDGDELVLAQRWGCVAQEPFSTETTIPVTTIP